MRCGGSAASALGGHSKRARVSPNIYVLRTARRWLQASGARAKMLHAQLDADAVAVRAVTADGAEMRTVARVVGDEM